MIYDVVSLASIKPERNYTTDILLQWLKIKGVGLGVWETTLFSVSSQIYGHLRVENTPSIPSFLATQIVYIGYGQFKNITPFPFTFL